MRSGTPDELNAARHLEELESGEALCVLTGQQLGLYLGPVFSLYKIASAISLARTLRTRLARPVVPIFWLQSEDHDFDEVRGFNFPDAEHGFIRGELPKSAAADKLSVGTRKLPKEAGDLLSRASEKISAIPEKLNLLRSAYQEGKSLSAAFRDLLGGVFAGSGLLLYDPQHPRAREGSAPFMLRALEDSHRIEEALFSQTEGLVLAGHKEQVSLRRGSPLFFVHFPDEHGPRFRLQWRKDRYEAIGGSFTITREELLEVIQNSPGRISSSALLRPLLQDSLFPTLAYVGGDAELRYLLQLSRVYPLLGLAEPARVRRLSAFVEEARTTRLLRELSLSMDKILFRRAEVEQQLRGAALSPEAFAGEAEKRVSELIRYLEDNSRTVERQLAPVIVRAADKVRRAVAGVTVRYASALEERNDVQLARYRKLLAMLFPQDIPQERAISAAYYLLRYGDDFPAAVLGASQRWSEVLSNEPRILKFSS